MNLLIKDMNRRQNIRVLLFFLAKTFTTSIQINDTCFDAVNYVFTGLYIARMIKNYYLRVQLRF